MKRLQILPQFLVLFLAVFSSGISARTNASSRALATLSYNIVKVNYESSVRYRSNAERYSWLKVETLGGTQGFVAERFVRSPISYRAAFEKKKGR